MLLNANLKCAKDNTEFQNKQTWIPMDEFILIS